MSGNYLMEAPTTKLLHQFSLPANSQGCMVRQTAEGSAFQVVETDCYTGIFRCSRCGLSQCPGCGESLLLRLTPFLGGFSQAIAVCEPCLGQSIWEYLAQQHEGV